MAEPNALRILVVNGKGGCGKTTIATNLAAAYARLGFCVALSDHDSQASSAQWLEQRPPRLPTIHLVPAHERPGMYTTRSFQRRLPIDVERIIIDTPSAVGDRDLDGLLRGVDAILVPLLPSSIDIRAGGRFIAQLLNHRSYRASPKPVAVIANRVRHNTATHQKLMEFLDTLEVPTIATFTDCAMYTRLADGGNGLFDDVSDALAEREAAEWCQVMQWIDDVAIHGRNGSPQRSPVAATPRQRNPESAEA
jgi:chromosome partitioning protein